MKKLYTLMCALALFFASLMPTDAYATETKKETCTLSSVFWMQHLDVWPAPFTPDSQICQLTFSEIMDTPSDGTPWYILAHAWIPAQLNVANGAVGDCLGCALKDAEELLSCCDFSQCPDNVYQYLALTGTLTDYNNGVLTGCPGCSEGTIVICPPCICPQCPQCPGCCCPPCPEVPECPEIPACPEAPKCPACECGDCACFCPEPSECKCGDLECNCPEPVQCPDCNCPACPEPVACPDCNCPEQADCVCNCPEQEEFVCNCPAIPACPPAPACPAAPDCNCDAHFKAMLKIHKIHKLHKLKKLVHEGSSQSSASSLSSLSSISSVVGNPAAAVNRAQAKHKNAYQAKKQSFAKKSVHAKKHVQAKKSGAHKKVTQAKKKSNHKKPVRKTKTRKTSKIRG